MKFSPVRSSVNYERGEAEGHYRRINRNIVSRNPEDGREPLRNTEMDVVGNVDGAWHLRFRESKPEFLGLLAEAVEYLNAHNTDFMHQIGGSRNFGAGVAYCELINPLYTERELKRVFDRGKGKTNAMEEKDEEWENNHRHEIETALDYSRLEGADAYLIEVVTPFVLESEYPGANDRGIPWWWSVDEADHLRMRTEKVVEDREPFDLRTVDHGQVVGYEGDRPVETARNGILRVGSHSKYGFGELRVKPVEPRDEEPIEDMIENSAKV